MKNKHQQDITFNKISQTIKTIVDKKIANGETDKQAVISTIMMFHQEIKLSNLGTNYNSKILLAVLDAAIQSDYPEFYDDIKKLSVLL